METPDTANPSAPRELLGRAPRILVADDDDDTRMEIADGLAGEGCVVIEARNGDELLDLVVRHAEHQAHFDAIVTDVVMPGFSGLDILAAFRGRTASVPVLVITGHQDPHTHFLAASLGAAAVLHKPFSFDKLRLLLAKALNRATPAPADD
jgi:DNA-binding NtrC family response regulator